MTARIETRGFESPIPQNLHNTARPPARIDGAFASLGKTAEGETTITAEIDDFVDSLQPLAAEIGPELTRELVWQFGGMRLYVPRIWRETHDINILGEAAARKLCRLFGGERLEIPRVAFSAAGMRRLALEMRAAGMVNSAIARHLGCNYRTVTQRLAEA